MNKFPSLLKPETLVLLKIFIYKKINFLGADIINYLGNSHTLFSHNKDK